MSRFWLVRHAPTHARTMVGWTDIAADLSDQAQIARLHAFLPAVPVVSSDLSRAIRTADCLAPRLRLPHDPGLREIHFGAWEMKTHLEAEASDPHLIRAFWDQPGTPRAPGGESWDDLTARIGRTLSRLSQQADELIIVAHFGAILAALQLAGGLTAPEVLSHKIDNLSVTSISFAPGAMHQINHIP